MVKIYALVDPSTGLVRYIGQTIRSLQTRLRGHINESEKKQTHKQVWIQYLLRQDKKPVIIELCSCEGQELANKMETFFISHFSKYDLTNSANGSGVNFKFGQAAKDKMSASKKKFLANVENRKRMTELQLEGKRKMPPKVKKAKSPVMPHDEVIKKMQAAGRKKLKETGYCKSEKNINHISALASAIKASHYKLFAGYMGGKEIGRWGNKSDAARELSLFPSAVSNCVNGKRDQVKGYVFKYL